MTPSLSAGVARRYKWLGFDAARQQGFAQKVLHKDAPETVSDVTKLYAAQRAMLLRLMRPYHTAFTHLVNGLYTLRHEMTQGDRRRLSKIAAGINDDAVTPEHVNTARQLAHKYDVDCGFPAFRELADRHQ